MPALSFTEIASAQQGPDRDQFEMFAREFLLQEGFEVIAWPDRGADGGRDLILKETREGPGGSSEILWLVSCKHSAHSGASVGPTQEANIRDRLETHECTGFIAFYSTLPSSGLTPYLDSLRPKLGLLIYDREEIERKLLDSEGGRRLAARFMPVSFRKWAASSQFSSTGLDLDLYQQAMRGIHDKPDPFASQSGVPPVSLNRLLVPLHLKSGRPDPPAPKDWLTEKGLAGEAALAATATAREIWEKAEREPAQKTIGRVPHLVVLGDPGAGKSTLLRQTLLTLVAVEESQLLLPVLVVAKDIDPGVELFEWIAQRSERERYGLPEAQGLRRLFDGGQLLLLVDGLDEVVDLNRRAELQNVVLGLVRRRPQNRVVLTSRIIGFDHLAFHDSSFQMATLDELQPDEAEQFLAKRFEAKGLAAEEATQAATELMEAIGRRPQLAAITGNPLILAMIARLPNARQLVATKVELYDEIIDQFAFEREQNEKRLPPLDTTLQRLGRDEFCNIYRHIAWAMTDGDCLGANLIASKDLRQAVRTAFHELGLHAGEVGRAVDHFPRWAAERSGLLLERGENLFGFVHRTFLEYLAAQHLFETYRREEGVKHFTDTQILPHISTDAWVEIIRLCVAMIGRLRSNDALQIVEAIVEREGRIDRVALAFECLSEMPAVALLSAGPAVQLALRRLASGMSWMRRNAIGAWPDPTADPDQPMPAGGMNDRSVARVVDALKSHKPKDWPKFTWSVDQLPPPTDVATYLYSNLLFAIEERLLIQGRLSEVAQVMLQFAPDTNVRYAALEALLRAQENDPAIGEILLAVSECDPAPVIRWRALSVLIASFAADPVVSAALPEILIQEQSAGVVRWLGHTAAEAAANLEHCCAQFIAWTNSHFPLRFCAFHVLLWLFNRNAKSLDLVLNAARGDYDPQVRAHLLAELKRCQPDSIDLEHLFRERASQDPDADARKTAMFGLIESMDHRDVQLLLQDKDRFSVAPGPYAIDPSLPITLGDVSARATHNAPGHSEQEVKDRYEQLAEIVPITLEWLKKA